MKTLTLTLLIFFPPILLHAGEFHVAKTGDNVNPGSQDEPLLTIQRAADLAQPGDTITVHAGIYREHVDPPRGGTADDNRIVYRAAPGEKVEIRGSEVIKGWTKQEKDIWTVTLPNSFFGSFNPYNDLIFGDYMPRNKFNQHTGRVYINQKRLTEAADREEFDQDDHIQRWFADVSGEETTLWARFRDADPNREDVEINVRRSVFYPTREQRNYITVRGFALSRAACNWAPPSAEQVGLLGTHWSRGWIVESNIITHASCVGITLGKFGDEHDNTYRMNSQGWNKGVDEALAYGWNGESVGHHQVLNNDISLCEQAGMVGSLGAIFSTVRGNVIHRIGLDRRIDGFEKAGIKFHAPIDVIISNNHIFNTRGHAGIWLDWMTQGTRITRNLMHDNTRDIFVEVSHGPFLADNNICLSSHSGIWDASGGGAYVHNLFGRGVDKRNETERSTPYHKPHSTEILGRSKVIGDDERFFNNIFAGKPALDMYNEWSPTNLQAVGNAYLGEGQPSVNDVNAYIAKDFDPAIRIMEEDGAWWLEMNVDPGLAQDTECRLVTTDDLGTSMVSGARYEQRDGSPYVLDRDFFGKPRPADRIAPGPLVLPTSGKLRVRVWPIP